MDKQKSATEIVERIIKRAPLVAEELNPEEMMAWIAEEIWGKETVWWWLEAWDFDWSNLLVGLCQQSQSEDFSNLAKGRLKTVVKHLDELETAKRQRQGKTAALWEPRKACQKTVAGGAQCI